MRVIGVGFGRTGTASLKVALERLGAGPCYHMSDVIARPERARAWIAAATDQPPAWEEIFDGFASTVDWPGAAFWEELVEAYPEAKVILTVRDPQRWYDSAESTIFRAWRRARSPLARSLVRLSSVRNPAMPDFRAMTEAIISQRVFDGREGDRAYATGVFEQHISDVQKVVPSERLLIFEVTQGWQPLCDFLGAPVPDEPFPRINDATEFNRRQVAARRRMLGSVAAVAGVAAAALAAVRALRTRRR
jgi:hypothetical protein